MSDTPARAHLALHLRRVALLVQRHMRLRAERYLQTDGSYSDLCVAPHEMRAFFTGERAGAAQTWLDQLGVPPLDALERALHACDTALEEGVEQTRAGHDTDDPATASLLPIEELRAGFLLEPLELDLLLCAAAPRLDLALARMLTVAWVDFSVRQPTAGFLAELVARDAREAQAALERLGDDGALLRHRLVVAAEHPLWTPHTPRLHAPIAVPQRILDFLAGCRADVAAQPGCSLHTDGLARDALVLTDDNRQQLLAALRRARPRLCLVGPQRAGRRTVARSVAHELGLRLLEVDLVRALAGTDGVVTRLAELLREARLHHAALLLRTDALAERTPVADALLAEAAAVRALVAEYPAPVFVAANAGGARIDSLFGAMPELVLTPPGLEAQKDLWRRALDGAVPERTLDTVVDDLARSYRLVPGTIFGAVEQALDQGPGRAGGRKARGGLSSLDLVRSIRRQFDHGLGWLADIVSVPLSLDELVLGPELRDQIDEVLRYARHSERVFDHWGFGRKGSGGRGLSVMFSGPPGTGKTLSAGVLARELGRVLYRIDLSRIVDKYIGETEKNLGRVFDEAERAQAVLLFDEADSLFASRTSVKSSNDRYANLEVNFLLQRLEDFDGVSILTTNFAHSIDDAFQRRIRFKIEFPLPDAELRAELWERLLPPAAPRAPGLDLAVLGEDFEFSGGHIRNAVLRAAIQAADLERPIDLDMLQAAARAEAREMGQLLPADSAALRADPDDWTR